MLSKELEISLNLAVNEAARRGHQYVTTEHILYALLYDQSTIELIEACNGSVEGIKQDLEKFFDDMITDKNLTDVKLPQPTVAFQRVIQRAAQQVHSAGKEKINISNIIVSLYSEPDCHAAYFLKKQNISRLDVIRYISHGVSKEITDNWETQDDVDQNEIDSDFNSDDSFESKKTLPKSADSKKSQDPLENYAVDLCEKAKKGLIDPLIGRQTELERTMQILCRRQKNNPLFVGDAGVGKTAMAEGLALRIVNKKVPKILDDSTIFALDMGALLAGSKFRGDFEQRIKKVLNRLKEIDKAILFIDEIHTVIGAGAVSGGSMDASNILKPVLSTGEIRCIGSTTYKEFRNIFESDHALARRFQKIDIEEPTIDDTINILKGLKTYYEEFHNVRYSGEALKKAVELAARYITDRKLPDKAIDVIDETAAAAVLKGKTDRRKNISVDMIQATVAKMAKVPIKKVSIKDKSFLHTLDKDIKNKVFGQDEAIVALVNAIKLSRSGLGEKDKPIGSFLFTGPTGVGKTEVAKQLASVMGVELIRYDMSEYMERHSVSRLIGSPPGYVGFDQGGLLTEAITKTPHAVLLFDEMEKAHNDMQNILLQVMDHGTLTDNNGRKANFRNSIIIMTTNAGAYDLARKSIGFSRTHGGEGKGVPKAVKDTFSPEFRNRLNAIISFKPLDMRIVKMVVHKFIREVNESLSAKKVQLKLMDKAALWLAEKGYDPIYGARPIKRLVEEKVKKPLADELLFGKLESGGTCKIDVDGNNELAFTFHVKKVPLSKTTSTRQ